MSTTVPDLVEPVDWANLRSQRSPFWKPGMNTRYEPYVALGETNLGQMFVPCGRNVAHAREVVARWHTMALQGTPVNGVDAIMYGAAVIDPRGQLGEAWKLADIGSVPNPGGPPRWTPIRRLTSWATCLRCDTRRWPGCYVQTDLDGCSLCLPPTEADDPRTWPEQAPMTEADPDTAAAKKAAKKRRSHR